MNKEANMKTFKTGDQVGHGMYLSIKAFDACYVGSDQESLAGKKDANYVRIPSLLMVVLAPVMGGLFALFFPVIVLAMMIGAASKLVANGVSAFIRSQAHVAEMEWQPGAAYLKKTKGKGKNIGDKGQDLKDLNKEVNQRRHGE